MSDEIDVRQGDSRVATDELLTAVEGYRGGADHLRHAQHLVSSAHRMGLDGICDTGAYPALTEALGKLQHALNSLESLANDAEDLGLRLKSASDAYAWCESTVRGIMHTEAQIQMGVLGVLLGGLVPWWAWMLPMGEADDEAKPSTPLDGTGQLELLPLFLSLLFSNPAVVQATADHVDGGTTLLAGLGWTGFVVLAKNREPQVPRGAQAAAQAGIAAGGQAGLLMEGGVAVDQTARQTTMSAPDGVADSFDRLPAPTENDRAQVKIEAIHHSDDTTSYEVYIAGTQSFDVVSRGEPNDMTSNFWSLAGKESGAYRAVVEAMKLAGITSTSEVNFFGHSQGGLLAAQLAASGDYNAKNVVSWGAPNGIIDVPTTVNSIIITHDEDPIPALGGNPIDRDALFVSRSLYDSVFDIPTDRLVPAHHAEPYLETSQLIDEGTSPALLKALDVLAESRRGATSVTSTTYLATRTDAG